MPVIHWRQLLFLRRSGKEETYLVMEKTKNRVSTTVKSVMNTRYGAGGRTRTGTLSPAVDFESTTSTIPSHRQVCLMNHQPCWRIVYCGRLRRRYVATVCGARCSPWRKRLRRSPTAALAAPSLHPPQAALGLATVDFESTTSTIPSHRQNAYSV